jgi:hypothetical protein
MLLMTSKRLLLAIASTLATQAASGQSPLDRGPPALRAIGAFDTPPGPWQQPTRGARELAPSLIPGRDDPLRAGVTAPSHAESAASLCPGNSIDPQQPWRPCFRTYDRVFTVFIMTAGGGGLGFATGLIVLFADMGSSRSPNIAVFTGVGAAAGFGFGWWLQSKHPPCDR